MGKAIKFFSALFLVTQITTGFPAVIYNYLCGGDEDGCQPGEPDTCICVASSPENIDTCFTYEGCVPPNPITKKCAHDQINEKTEARCLATLWQSEPMPPCAPLDRPPASDICASKCTSLDDCEPTKARYYT